MIITKHLLNDIKPLRQEDRIGDILDIMEELKYSHLPVVDADRQYLGVVCEDDLLEISNEDDTLEKHLRLLRVFSLADNHEIFLAVRLIGQENLTLLPVVNRENKYLGYVSAVELMQDMGRELSFAENGSVLVLRMPSRDFHLAQIAQIVESDDAKIIGFLLGNDPDTNQILICLKINQLDLTRIIHSFERYNYTVSQVFHQGLLDDGLEDRYDAFMNYLNT